MLLKSRFIAVVAWLSVSLSGGALAASEQNSANLTNGILQAKSVVDRAIAATGAQPGEQPGGGQPGGWPGGQPGGWPGGQPGGQPGGSVPGGNPWFVNEDILIQLNENDQLGLPILLQASSSLSQAASFADNSKLAFNAGNIQLGNFKFAQACNSMGIARSQIARANTAAMQFPVGMLAAFGNELRDTVIELNNLRASEACP